MIYAVLRYCYLSVVQTDGPAPPGSSRNQNPNLKKVCVMSLAKLDRFAPVFLIFLGLIAAGGTAGLGV